MKYLAALHGCMSKLFLFVAILRSSRGQFARFGSGNGCRPFTCSAGSKPVQAWPLKVKSSGCAGVGNAGFSSTMVQQDNAGKYLEHCCDMRFACMQVCGVTKQKCDIQFKKCTDKACRKQPFITTGGEPKECKTVIGLKVAMAQMEQCNDFEAAQKRACKCKKESKVDRARRKFLTKFYAKFATKKPDVDSLMEKHGSTPRKFSDLVIKLMKKYSKKVVKRVADPMQERMNEILRKMREQEAAGKMGKKNSDSEPDGGAYDDYDEEEDEFDYKEEGNSPPKRSKKKKKVQRAVEEEEIELTDDDGHQEL